ncbi:glycosyltransferase family A protein [Clostridium sp.]|uniref:glycosyltransferase family A protein n=1 Tax=Clostridium sp. TaxID=1506 RepID=UPI001A4EBC30|nr:glycosyltransferase family A protein [Clostridium sp.]MBK5241007.1 glycosyltransferase family 2 protein [Clostridium sp.]
MLNLLYKLVTPWGKSNRTQILKNRVLGRVANLIYPIYCILNHPTKLSESFGQPEVIVSLTSFPARIDKVNLCLESILRQSHPADKVILWLAKSQFKNKESLPRKLLNLEKIGVDIRFCEDLKSYKKIFYTAKLYPKDNIITADDDVLYPEDWIEKLIDTHDQNPECVCCYRASEIVVDNDYNILPYKEWRPDGIKGPSYHLLPTGVGGVLYPSLFFENVDINYEVIKEICPTTDDLWLKIVSLIKKKKVVKVNLYTKEWFTIRRSQDVSLMDINVDGNLNDIAFGKLIDFFNIKFGEYKDE